MLKELRNVAPVDDLLEKKVKVLPYESMKLSELRIDGAFAYKYQFLFKKLHIEPYIKTIEIHDGLKLNIIQNDLEQTLTFQMLNERDEAAHFELKFNNTKGIKTESGLSKFEIDTLPRSRNTVCAVHFSGE